MVPESLGMSFTKQGFQTQQVFSALKCPESDCEVCGFQARLEDSKNRITDCLFDIQEG